MVNDLSAWPYPTDNNPNKGYPVLGTEESFKVYNTTLNKALTKEQTLQWVNSITAKDPIENVIAEKDPTGLELNAPGAKADYGKNRVWLCLGGFSNALLEVARVTTIGATKYTPNGWTSVPDGSIRYMDAFGRHMLDLGTGKVLDDGPGGTGCYHKAQMIWNLLASLELDLRKEKE